MSHLHLITGSTLGGAEYVADHLSDLLNDQGIETSIHNEADLQALDPTQPWLLISSTHGAGELPENIQPFYAQLQASEPLTKLRYAIIGIGDSSYDTFCAAAHQLDDVLSHQQAHRLTPVFTIDVTQVPVPEDEAEAWLSTFLSALCE
ncbi:FMN-binding protein MioC [Thaumasiovibrio subtropicus]|uniref:FMN-binding protein MioC n=1 Tax=Thaumasiovibrio subtropicus TaxID=1891207 RepID=UPI000B3530A2|nr:FMN-binding protein MioC [Thaumasiovibrio subtropicus]